VGGRRRPPVPFLLFFLYKQGAVSKVRLSFFGSSTSRNNPTNQPPVQERNSNRGANQEESRTLTAISIERGGGFGRREGMRTPPTRGGWKWTGISLQRRHAKRDRGAVSSILAFLCVVYCVWTEVPLIDAHKCRGRASRGG